MNNFHEIFRIDPSAIYQTIKEILFTSILIPMKIWNNVPKEIKIAIFILIMILSVWLIVWLKKNKEDWRFVKTY